MPRTRTAVKLTPDQQSKVDALIRRYGYVCFDLVKAELAASGITFSRSALHRHAQRLKSADLRSPSGLRETVVIVLDASAGAPTAIRTPASPETVVSAIGALGLPASAGRPEAA
ncbi:MAG: DUF3486 family protein [Elusimicrobia bacterium]|nr:MAG: DUF3486 family protein [Elusimicrobiota bacterium]